MPYFYYRRFHISENYIYLCIWTAVARLGWILSRWYQCRRMSQIPEYGGKRTAFCFTRVVVYWSRGLVSFSLSFSLSPVTFHPSLCPFSCVLFCLRHTYAQFVLWWLQARAVCEAFIWCCDQVRMLLCQHGVCLRRALPALPTTKLWYG